MSPRRCHTLVPPFDVADRTPALTLIEGEGGRGLHPDARGRPLPAVPRVGLCFRVQWGGHFCLADEHRVIRVTGRSFTVRGEGQRVRRPLEEWSGWLGELVAKGRVTVVASRPTELRRVR